MRLNTEIFKKRVQDVVGDEYSVLGEYVDYNYTKIKMRHNICGYEYDILPGVFLKGSRCAKCGGTLKYTTETYAEKVKELVGNEYSVLGEYKNNKTKLLMKHNKCGTLYEVKPNVFLNGCRCPECRPNKAYKEESLKKKIEELVGDEYSVVGKFVNARTKIEMKHNKCGHVYKVAPSTFISGSRCPKCFKSVAYSTEEFKRKALEAMGQNYCIIGEYNNMNTKIKVKHLVCGSEYEVLPTNFLRGNGCPTCSSNLQRSLPEEIVAYFVKKYFEIEQGFRPEWLKFESGQKAEIDIWIPSLKIGIEYDGNLHSQKNKKNNDAIKNEIVENTDYCNLLIRICESKVAHTQQVYKKIKFIEAHKSIAITNLKGVDELELLIKQCIEILGVNNEDIIIDKEVINICKEQIEKYYEECGKPLRPLKMRTRKSNTQEFKRRVEELCAKEYSVLGEYTYALDDILMKHNKCGNEYWVRPNSFLSGRRCPYCSNRIKITPDIYCQKLKDAAGEEYICLDDYTNSKVKVNMEHKRCGNRFMVYPLRFLNNLKCPICEKKRNQVL